MKQFLKDHIAEFFLAFGLSFMLYFYEPLFLYSSNTVEFWFDIYIYFKYVLIEFIIMFLIILIILLLLSKLFKNCFLYKRTVLMIYIIMYIQGNYLIGQLPKIDGVANRVAIGDSSWIISNLLSGIVIIAAYLGVKYLIKKRTVEYINKVIKYTVVIISLMLTTATVSLMFTPHLFDKKDNISTTYKNLNAYSSNKNFIIFVADTIDMSLFNSRLENKDLFKDFTNYKDTTSMYLFTRYAVPHMLSGNKYYNEGTFVDYFSKSIDESKFLNTLKESNYTIDLYEAGLVYNSKNYDKIDNLKKSNEFDLYRFIQVETKYMLYKYVPYFLKDLTNINSLNFNYIKTEEFFEYENDKFYYNTKKDIDIVDNNMFKYIHIKGGHSPHNMDANLNKIDGTYFDSLDVTITILESYINQLKNKGVYDNSVIIITADHGAGTEYINRCNPILYIKGINEHHEYQESSDKVSFDDLQDAYFKLLNGEDSTNLFKDKQPNDKRTILMYSFEDDDVIYEYSQESNAWDFGSLKYTGKSYKKR